MTLDPAALPRIEPAPNYPAVNSGEPPTVVQVTEDDLITARQRVAELAAALGEANSLRTARRADVDQIDHLRAELLGDPAGAQ